MRISDWSSDVCSSDLTEFDYAMTVTRFRETPRVTKPISDENWQKMLALGDAVDGRLTASDMRLTMGGEPTFVSVDDMEGAEWNTEIGRASRRERECPSV